MQIDWQALFAGLDRSGPVPLYHQVAVRLREAIGDGSLPPGTRLENEVALAALLGISRPTMRQAIQDLVDRGLLVRRRGVGTQVVAGHVTRSVKLTSLFDDLTATGHRPTTDVLALETVGATDAVAAALAVEPRLPVTFMRRVRRSDGVAFAILENHLPTRVGSFEAEALTTSGLYALLRERGIVLRVARQTIGARGATREEATLLGVEVGAPVLTMTRVAYDASGDAVEWGEHCYLPQHYSFEITLVEH